MDDLLFGMETELAFSALSLSDPAQPALFEQQGGVARAVEDVLQGELLSVLLELATQRVPTLSDSGGEGLFLSNGSRLYVDAGRHPELCTPECRSPEEVVRWQLAGERLLVELLDDLAKQRPEATFALYRGNVDHGGNGTSWGCHESYQHRSNEADLQAHLIPHLVSRIVYTGAGGLNNKNARGEFLISPRVPHLAHAVGADSQRERALYHTKNEPLSGGGWSRLHLICGESNASQLANYLKVGTTALIVRLIEEGRCSGSTLSFRRPLQAMNSYARDPSLRKRCRARTGRRLTAIDLQREYLVMVEAQLGEAFMPDWAPAVCARWRDVLDRLEADPDSLSTRLDWRIKHALFDHRIEASGSRWGELQSSSSLGSELCEIDLRFGQLGPEGLFERLDRSGALDHGLHELGSVDEAIRNPPPNSRAARRGLEIVRLAADSRARYRCDWSIIVDHHSSSYYDLSDPYGRNARWLSDLGDRFFRRGARVHRGASARELDRGIALYRDARYAAAAEHLANAALVTRPPESGDGNALARFFCASAYRDVGRLADAAAMLEPILDRAEERSTALRVQSQFLRIQLELPAPRAKIEAAMARLRSLARSGGRRITAARAGILEARCAFVFGEFEAAAERLEEAFVLDGFAGRACVRGEDLPWITRCLLRANREERATSLLADWRSVAPTSGTQRRIDLAMRACAGAWLVRSGGRSPDALTLARRALELSPTNEPNRFRTIASCLLAECALDQDDLATAGEELDALESASPFESRDLACEVHVATTRFHRARARALQHTNAPDAIRERADGDSVDLLEETETRAAESQRKALYLARLLDVRVGTSHRLRDTAAALRAML